jgi:RNase H-like domain found in reverse transcriptase
MIHSLPDFSKGLILTTDAASYEGVAYILGRRDEHGQERVVSYEGTELHSSKEKRPVTQFKCLALLEGVNFIRIQHDVNSKLARIRYPSRIYRK